MPTYKITLPGGETYRVNSPTELTDAQAYAAVQSQIASGSTQETGRGGVLPSLAEGFVTSFTGIPLGVAGLVSAAPEETAAGKFSIGAEKAVQNILGIDPTKEATTAEAVAGGLGSLASFLVPGTAVAKGAKVLGTGAKLARGLGYGATAAQAVPLGAAEQVQRRMGEEATTGVGTAAEDRLASQRLGAAIGLTELVPLRRFMGPLEEILARVPISKAGGVAKTVEMGVKRALGAATEEGAQEALAQTAQNLVEQGYYNPDLDITEGLLGSAGVGGAAGGTLDVVLQLMAGRKNAGFRKKAAQLQTTLAKQGAEKRPEQIRADANAGLEKLRAAAPVGNISIKREVPTTGLASFSIIGEDGKAVSSFSTPDAAVLAAEQYEKDAGGLAKFNRPTIAEMSGQAAVKPTKQEKAEGKKLAKGLKKSGALTPAPAQTPTTPAGQAAAVQGVAQVADATGATPAEVASPTKPIMRGKKRIAPVEAAPAEGLPSPESVTPPPASTTAAEIPAPKTYGEVAKESQSGSGVRIGDFEVDFYAGGRGKGNVPYARIRSVSRKPIYKDATGRESEVLDVWGVEDPNVEEPRTGPKAGINEADKYVPAPFRQIMRDWLSGKIDQTEAEKRIKATPIEPRKLSAIPAAETAPVSPTEAPPAAVQSPKAPTPSKPFTTSIEALFKPIANTPEDVAKLADFNNRKKQIAKELNKRLSPITGKNTRVKLIDAVSFTDKAGRTAFAEGEAKGGNIIYLSYNLYDPKLTNEQLVDKLFDVMNHEVIHSLTNLGVFKPGETKTLFNAAERIKYQGNQFSYYDRAYAMYSRMPNVTEEIIREEAVAEMFRDYRSGKLKLEGTPKGLVQRAIEFFRRIFSGFRDAKVGQIFKDIEAGKIGAREARAVEGGVRKLSALPEDDSAKTRLAQEADNAFRELAGGQRGEPELYMVFAQNALRDYQSGPALTYAMEHVGDLTHRMAQYGNKYPSYEFGIEFVVPKVRTGLSVVTNRVDAERIAKLPDDPTLKKYADAHSKLKVYNEAQRAARDAAVALGRKDLKEAERNLLILQEMIDDGTYVEIAGSYDPNYGDTRLSSKVNLGKIRAEGGVRKFSIAPAVETKEFKNWFKRSKILDEQGKPLVVHHFGSFNEDEDIPRSGMHFGTRQAAIDRATGKRADDAAMGVETYQNDDGLWHFDADGVTSEELGFVGFRDQETALAHGRSNVLEMIANDVVDPLELGTVTSAYLSIQNPKRMADLGGANGEWDQAIAQAKSEGYDGIVYRNQYEDKGSDSYIAFKATQIKSTSNRGTFSPEEENIKLSVIPSITTEIKTAVDIAENVTKSGEATQADVDLANQSVRDAVRKLSTIPQVIPMPPEMEDANKRIFAATHVASTPGEKLMGVLGGISSREGIGRLADMFRVYYVQKTGQITKREREAFLTGALNPDEAQFAEYSATGAADMMQRSSHYTVEAAYHGAPVIRGLNEKREAVSIGEGADPNSAYMYIEKDQADSPLKVLEKIITGGPGGGDLTEQFRSYAVAQVSKRRLSEGKEIPEDVTPEYISAADALAEQYPIIKEAFESYQRFNTKLLEAVRDSGYLSQELFEEFTDQQNYYSMYRQLEEGDVVQEISGGLASRIRFKPYEGSTTGNLMADPIVAMMHNVAFWNNVILRTLATQKAFRVGEATGVVKRLRAFEDEDGNVTIETPSRADGFDDKTFYTYINGVEVPFASRDPLFTIGLSGNDFASPSLFLELAGMPANFLREMVTRDPGFMVANLMRDSVSTWVLAGSGANPFQTFKGFVSALNSSASFEALRSYGVVGSFDEAQKPMAKIVAGMRKKLTRVQGLPNMTSALTGAWDKLGSWSEASDAATRIAVYDAAKRDGASDFTAAYRALSIMNFSRSGHSAGLRMWTRMVPFLNARIQGFDVLYTGMKAAAGVVTGREQLSFERQRGTHVLVRGMALTAAAMALSLFLDDDEDYQQLPQYIKDANILIPIPGQKGQYFQIPKPFEAGFLFMTVPQTFYDVAMGNRSMRSATKLMFNQFSSTFGFNPIPQAALPVVENMINRDFYTGQPLVSPGMEQLETSLQYNASTSYVARGLSQLSGFLPINYDFEEGRFVPISPIKLDNLISGYGGPIMSYVGMGIGGAAYMFGSDNQGLPVAGSQLPVIRRFFVDARDKQPQAATEAYELYQLVDKVNRTISRLKKMGDTEALREYREENINVLRVGKQVRKMADNLNNIRAQIRRLEADKVTPMSQKLEKLRELRSREARVTQRIDEINQQLGR